MAAGCDHVSPFSGGCSVVPRRGGCRRWSLADRPREQRSRHERDAASSSTSCSGPEWLAGGRRETGRKKLRRIDACGLVEESDLPSGC